MPALILVLMPVAARGVRYDHTVRDRLERRNRVDSVTFTWNRRNWVAALVTLTVVAPFMAFTLPAAHSAAARAVIGAAIGLALLRLLAKDGKDLLRRRDRVVVSGDAITFRRWADGQETILSPRDGGILLAVPVIKNQPVLDTVTELGPGHMISLSGVPINAFWRACRQHGWVFGCDPAEGRAWRRGDWPGPYEVILISLPGLFDLPAYPGAVRSRAAALLAEHASRTGSWEPRLMARGSRRLRRQADTVVRGEYQRAAAAQRYFAGLASSPREQAARADEAGRLESMARSW